MLSDTTIIEQWLYGLAAPTQKAYLRDLEKALRWMGGVAIAEIDLGHLQGYQTHLISDRHDAPATVNRKMSSVRSLLIFAHDQGHIPRNPTTALKSPKVHNNLHERTLTTEQVEAICNAATTDRNRAFLRLAYATGARISELCNLLWKDCKPKPDGSAVVWFLGKREKWRPVRVPAAGWFWVGRLRNGAPDDRRVFGFKLRQASDITKAAVLKAGAPPEASTHWIRHSTASHSLDAGAPISVVRDTLGHSSVAVTDRYLQGNPDKSAGDYLKL